MARSSSPAARSSCSVGTARLPAAAIQTPAPSRPAKIRMNLRALPTRNSGLVRAEVHAASRGHVQADGVFARIDGDRVGDRRGRRVTPGAQVVFARRQAPELETSVLVADGVVG